VWATGALTHLYTHRGREEILLLYLAQGRHLAKIAEEMTGKVKCFNVTGFDIFFVNPVIRLYEKQMHTFYFL
jgi:hypothetical protein